MLIGNKVHILPTCHSTNDFIKNKNTADLSNGEVFCAVSQTSGKGQRGNSWETEPGKNLTFSFFLNDLNVSISDQFAINYFVGLAIHRFLSPFVPDKNLLKLKWPNDIYYNNQKIGGILIENQVKNGGLSHSIIGIGLNINQEVFKVERATSIFIETDEEYDIKEALGFLLKELNTAYLEFQKHVLADYKLLYMSKLMNINKIAKYWDNLDDCLIYGKIVDVRNDGILLLKVDNQVKEYNLKEITFLFD